MVIILNGSSSSGKSSIAKEIMHKSQIPFFYYSADFLVNEFIDSKFVSIDIEVTENWQKDWFCHKSSQNINNHPIVMIEDGKKAKALNIDLIESICLLAKKGHNLIIDEVIWHEQIFLTYIHHLRNISKIYLIKVNCAIEEAEKREESRQDRYIGLARGTAIQVDSIIPFYDLTIDSTQTLPEENAKIVLDFIDQNSTAKAFLLSASHFAHKINI